MRTPQGDSDKMLGTRVPDDLHRRLKTHAAASGESMQAVVVAALEAYLEKEGK